jgi:hypothetical protein
MAEPATASHEGWTSTINGVPSVMRNGEWVPIDAAPAPGQPAAAATPEAMAAPPTEAASPGLLETGGPVAEGAHGLARGITRGVADIANIPGNTFVGVNRGLDWLSTKLGRESHVADTIPPWISHDYGQDIRDTASAATGVDLGESKGIGIPAETIGRSVAPAAITGPKNMVEAGIKFGAVPTAAGEAAAAIAPEDQKEAARLVASLGAGGVAALTHAHGTTGPGATTTERQIAAGTIGDVAKKSTRSLVEESGNADAKVARPDLQRAVAAELLKNESIAGSLTRDELIMLRQIAAGQRTYERMANIGEGGKLDQLWVGLGLGGVVHTGAQMLGVPSDISAALGTAAATWKGGKAAVGKAGAVLRQRWVVNKLNTLQSIINGGQPANQLATRAGGLAVAGERTQEQPDSPPPSFDERFSPPQ